MSLPAPESKTLVIVRVPAPWWAPAFLITGKFVESIPEYARAPGLLHKTYTLSEQREFGGVYLWDSRQSAEAWFDEKWHERVKAQRGVDGDVRMLEARYTLAGTTELSGTSLPGHALRTDAAITWLSSEPGIDPARLEALAPVLPQVHGVARVSFGVEQDGRLGVVTTWTSKSAAAAYWTEQRRDAVRRIIGPHAITTFDAPVVLDAARAKQDPS